MPAPMESAILYRTVNQPECLERKIGINMEEQGRSLCIVPMQPQHIDQLERLEKEFFVSREHIAREFKRQTGQTVHRYIVKARLDRCCTLIEQGLPITEVYKTSGFGGYNHFFRAFKKEYGMTPKEYFSTTRQDARG